MSPLGACGTLAEPRGKRPDAGPEFVRNLYTAVLRRGE
jgi:hypothetical protein